MHVLLFTTLIDYGLILTSRWCVCIYVSSCCCLSVTVCNKKDSENMIYICLFCEAPSSEPGLFNKTHLIYYIHLLYYFR